MYQSPMLIVLHSEEETLVIRATGEYWYTMGKLAVHDQLERIGISWNANMGWQSFITSNPEMVCLVLLKPHLARATGMSPQVVPVQPWRSHSLNCRSNIIATLQEKTNQDPCKSHSLQQT